MKTLPIEHLLKPSAYPTDVSSVRLLQTHVSYLFITDTLVYKVKKPVDLGFLDFTTLDRRRFYCNEEVRLNRRLSPGIYLGVTEVREQDGTAGFHRHGNVIDYAVVMKRLPEERMAAALVEQRSFDATDARGLARIVADFHAGAATGASIAGYGAPSAIAATWRENLRQIAPFAGDTLDRRDLALLRHWVERSLERLEPLLLQRMKEGRVRECDGDLHLDNICMTDPVSIFDCIEFNERFRCIDTASDIAFLLMDFEFRGRADLADAFLREYAERSGDRRCIEVVPFYKAYRAVVRGKVDTITSRDPQVPEEERRAARLRGEKHFRLARGYAARESLPPSLFLTCGLPGSGKSTLAGGLAFELGLEVLASDRIRKELARDEGWDTQLLYTEESTRRTYREILRRTEALLQQGEGAVVDATFRDPSEREQFAAAAAARRVPLYLLVLQTPEEEIRRRLALRSRDPSAVSDADWETYLLLRESFRPPAPDEGTAIDVDTTRGLGHNIRMILERTGTIPCG